MIDDRIKEWRNLAGVNHLRSKSRAGSGKLPAATFSDRYFELMGIISRLQGALNDACDVITAQENLRANQLMDQFETVMKNRTVE